MRALSLALILLAACQAAADNKIYGNIVVDKIEAIVSGPVATVPVLMSDITRQAFRGAPMSLKQLVEEILRAQHGQDAGVKAEKEDIDRYLRMMSRGATVSEKELEQMAKHYGYPSVDEFYLDLMRLYIANVITEQEIRSYLAVSEQEARTYYDKNPEEKDGVYYLQTALVPFDEKIDGDAHEKQLKQPGFGGASIAWGEVFNIDYKDLADNRAFVSTMAIDDVHVQKEDDGFHLYRLKNNTPPMTVPFEQRRTAIIAKLREQKFNDAYERYSKQIMEEADVEYRTQEAS